VRERQPRHVEGGAPRKQEFTLELAKYDDRAVL
jgi:phage protein U